MKVDLNAETAAAVDERLRAGEFATASELVVAGLRALDAQQARQNVRDKIAAGVAEIQQGKGIDGNKVFRELFAGLDMSIDGPKP